MIDRNKALIQAGTDVIVLDSSHGHSRGVMEAVAKIKNKFPDTILVAGNVGTTKATKDLIKAGADCS